jgi:la-related protein 1
MYGRAPGFPGGAPQLSPIQTFVPGMYDYSMPQHPMSAVPFTPYVDANYLYNMVTTQMWVALIVFIVLC